MKTGAELKARREELKITQQDLADKVGVSRTQLSRMESGKIKINNYIRTKIEAILTNSEEYKEPELTINDINKSMKKDDYLKMNEEGGCEFKYNLDHVYQMAKEAYKDGFIDSVGRFESNHDSYVTFEINDKHEKFWCTCIERAINILKSLYTEEFIIEKMADELKIKSGAELTLSNGINCVYFDDGDRKLRHDDDFYPCNFLVLKGATVKQSKGAK